MAPRGRGVGLVEGREQAGQLVGRDADALVLHVEAHQELGAEGVFEPGAQQDAAVLGELDGVAGEVQQHLLQPQRIAAQGTHQLGSDLDVEAESLAGGRLTQLLLDVAHHPVEHEAAGGEFQLARLDLGKIEDVVDDAQQVLARVVDLVQVAAQLRVGVRLQRQVGHADDAVHRGADLVAHVRQEVALGLVGRIGARLEFVQRGDVGRDAQHRRHLAFRVQGHAHAPHLAHAAVRQRKFGLASVAFAAVEHSAVAFPSLVGAVRRHQLEIAPADDVRRLAPDQRGALRIHVQEAARAVLQVHIGVQVVEHRIEQQPLVERGAARTVQVEEQREAQQAHPEAGAEGQQRQAAVGTGRHGGAVGREMGFPAGAGVIDRQQDREAPTRLRLAAHVRPQQQTVARIQRRRRPGHRVAGGGPGGPGFAVQAERHRLASLRAERAAHQLVDRERDADAAHVARAPLLHRGRQPAAKIELLAHAERRVWNRVLQAHRVAGRTQATLVARPRHDRGDVGLGRDVDADPVVRLLGRLDPGDHGVPRAASGRLDVEIRVAVRFHAAVLPYARDESLAPGIGHVGDEGHRLDRRELCRQVERLHVAVQAQTRQRAFAGRMQRGQAAHHLGIRDDCVRHPFLGQARHGLETAPRVVLARPGRDPVAQRADRER